MPDLAHIAENPTQAPLKVLLVEDCLEDRVLYKRLLAKNFVSFEVWEAENAAEGLALSRDNQLDCIVLDYHLPDADGIDFIQSFQLQSNKKQAPAIIMVTGQGNEKTAVEAMKLGALDYITKASISEGYFVQSILNAVERSHLRQQVLQYQRDLEKSNRALSEFAHIVSHDLKAPLRRMVSYCELLQEEAKDTLTHESADYVKRLVANAGRLQRFIDDLLAFSRVMHAEEEKDKMDLNKLIAEIIEDLDPLIEENNAKVIVDRLPMIEAYPLRMRQVFLNLLSNGIKYRGKDDPVLRVSVKDLGESYEFSVQDNGMGIAPAYQKNIFKAFQRLHAQDQIEGTGLGLSIVQEVINMHGGEVGVESDVGSGARFHFTIPKQKAGVQRAA